jgi:restriction system protein
MQYKAALKRNRTQTLREDDFGILVTNKWHPILYRFIEHRLEPEIRKLGPKAYALYETIRLNAFREMDDIIRRLPSSAPTFDLGPNNSGDEYEHYCAELLRVAGWDARTTKASGDQGTDIIAEKDGRRLVVQCKLYFRQPVPNKAVQEAYTACKHQQADWAVVVSNASYTASAQELANSTGVRLLCHTDLEDIDALLSPRPLVPTSTDNANCLLAEPSNLSAC